MIACNYLCNDDLQSFPMINLIDLIILISVTAPARLQQFNKHSNCGWSVKRTQLLSRRVFFPQPESSTHASQHPKRYMTLAGYAGDGNCRLFMIVLHVFDGPLFYLVSVMMHNLPESVHFPL